MQLGIHHADTLHYLLGPVRRVHGSFARLAVTADVDDVGTALLEFAGGTLAVLAGSYVSPKTFSLRLYGSEANLFYETDMSIWPAAEKMDGATTLTLQTAGGREPVTFEARDMLVEELAEFGRCIRGAAVPETGAAEGLAALQVIRGALTAHEAGRPIDVDSL
jgi:predicted dehydrogenase